MSAQKIEEKKIQPFMPCFSSEYDLVWQAVNYISEIPDLTAELKMCFIRIIAKMQEGKPVCIHELAKQLKKTPHQTKKYMDCLVARNTLALEQTDYKTYIVTYKALV